MILVYPKYNFFFNISKRKRAIKKITQWTDTKKGAKEIKSNSLTGSNRAIEILKKNNNLIIKKNKSYFWCTNIIFVPLDVKQGQNLSIRT